MTIAMLVETVAWICCRIRWWSGLRYAMLRATIIANLMTVEGNNANRKLMHINAHYRKEIIQKLKIAIWSEFAILLDTNCLALAVLNHSTVADDGDLKLQVAMVHEAITDF